MTENNAAHVAGQILTYLGYAQAVSMEPGADSRRDHIQSLINSLLSALRAPVADEQRLRRMLCAQYAGALAYMDDGEAQDARAMPIIDFLRDSLDEIERKMRLRASAPVADERAAYTDPLSDFQEGQWWVKELDELARAPGATHDQKRAVAVVHHMLRSAALASTPVAVAIQWPTMPESKGQSPILFEDGYAEGWAKCMDECQRAVLKASAPVAGEAEIMAIVREQCPDFDAAHEGPSEDDMISIARTLLSRYAAPQASATDFAKLQSAYVAASDRIGELLAEKQASAENAPVAGEARDAALWRAYAARFPEISAAFLAVHGDGTPQTTKEAPTDGLAREHALREILAALILEHEDDGITAETLDAARNAIHQPYRAAQASAPVAGEAQLPWHVPVQHWTDEEKAKLLAAPQASEAYTYARNLAVTLWDKHYKVSSPDWKPFDDLMGLLYQIDNMTASLVTHQAADALDAKRYRWVRDQTETDGIAIVMKNKHIDEAHTGAENIDKFIDAALSAQPGAQREQRDEN